jgi:hypothetical protein
MERVFAWALCCCLLGCATTPEAPPPPPEPVGVQYAPTPPSLLTPDRVETRVGTLEFFDGLPSESTVESVYDHLDFVRGVRAVIQTLPGVSMMAMRNGMDEAGMLPNYSILLTESLMDSKSLFLTQDTESVYAIAWISLKGGPIVIDTPPRAQGVFVDAWQRPLGETGKAGPDRGRGGQYVIVPPQYAGYVPRTQYAMESPTFGVWAVFRGFLSKGSPKRAIQTFKKSLKIYPLKEAKRPPPNMFVNVSGKAFSTLPPTDFEFFELLDDLIQEEPNESQGPELLGVLASIGIQKDEHFEPDARRKETLGEAALVGNATARALVFSPRTDRTRIYEERQWERIFPGGNHDWLKDGVREVDARARYFTFATAVTPTMESPGIESSSDAAVTFHDDRGELLDGSRTYTLTLPAYVPAKYFWSLTVYDNRTFSMLQTSQRFPSILSGQQGLRRNDDGSTTIAFGPNKPKDGKKLANWIQTAPGTGWNVILRLYGPEQAWFDRTWEPGDVELLPEIPSATPSRKGPKMQTEIPPSVLPKERVETRIGPVELVNGAPTAATTKSLYDNLDFVRGVDAFLSTLPGASLVAMRRGLRQVGIDGNDAVGIFERRMDAHSLFLTPNTESVYAMTWLDLRGGAFVVDSPPNTLGILDDFFFRYVADLGNAGPDEGKGGLFLFVPPMYEGQISELYFNYVSRTFGNLLFWRGFAVNGDPAPAVQSFRNHVQIYPLEFEISDDEIEAMEASEITPEIDETGDAEALEEEVLPDDAVRFVDLSGKPMNTISSSDFGFFEEIDELVQEELPEALGPELLALLSSAGIRKGTKFAPDAESRSRLTEAAAVANATARALAFRPRDETAYLYEDSAWYRAFVGNSYDFVSRGVRLTDARTMFFYVATGTTPAMVTAKIGKGSQYALAATDDNGNYLDGSKSYRLKLPPNIPAKQFWSIVVYDPQTRSMLQTPHSATPSLSSDTGTVAQGADGSTTIYFGPTPPPGRETNWIQTVPGKGWFTILRLYGPLKAWFDESWRPAEIEEIRWK